MLLLSRWGAFPFLHSLAPGLLSSSWEICTCDYLSKHCTPQRQPQPPLVRGHLCTIIAIPLKYLVLDNFDLESLVSVFPIHMRLAVSNRGVLRAISTPDSISTSSVCSSFPGLTLEDSLQPTSWVIWKHPGPAVWFTSPFCQWLHFHFPGAFQATVLFLTSSTVRNFLHTFLPKCLFHL